MVNERKIAALKEASDRKRLEALDKTNQAIALLVKEGKQITFPAVAQAAGVSVAYLYKYNDLRERIDQLRKQQNQATQPSQPQPASDKSKMVMINSLRERVKKLEMENSALRHQNEVIYGHLSGLQSVQQKVEIFQTENASLRAENAWLKEQLDNSRFSHSSTSSVGSNELKLLSPENQPEEQSVFSQKIQSELVSLGIKLNPTLNKTIRAAKPETVLNAITALKQAMTAGTIDRPVGWLKRAIQECWQPNESIQNTTQAASALFNQWFNRARAKGLVVASMRGEDGQMYVFDREGVRYIFEQMLSKYPLATLE